MLDNLKHFINSVKEFHQSFFLPFNETLVEEIPSDRYKLRHELMREENEEYLEAAASGNNVEVADALGDMLYILCGTIIEHGMQNKIQDVFDEIHRSNMSKLDESGNAILREDGKVLKSKKYFKPNLSRIMSQPSTAEILENLQEIFLDTADVENIEIDQSFEEIGIDSLDKIELLVQVESRWNIVIPDDQVEDILDIKELIKIIKTHI